MSDLSIERERVYDGVRISLDRMTMRSGENTPVVREMVVHPGAVVVLPILDDGRVVLIKNVRHGLEETLWEIPAGTLEPGEDPMVCAGRELIEEAGYEAGAMMGIGAFWTTPGFTDEKIWAYVATKLKPVGQDLDASEQIEAVPVPLEEVLRMIECGEIEDGKTVATVLKWYVFHRESKE